MQRTNFKNILLYGFLSVALSGCGIYKAYERPGSIEAGDNYRTDGLLEVKADADTLPGPAFAGLQPERLADTQHLGLLPWKEIFSDPKLQVLIQQGLDSNFDLRNALLQVRQMRARLVQARLSYTPGLNLSGNYTFSGMIGSGSSPSTYGIGAAADWEIDIFAKTLNAKRSAVANLLQSDAARRSAQTQVISAIAEAYYSLLMLDKQLEISEQTVSNWNRTIDMMQDMKTAGNTNQAAIEQAKANSYSVKAGIPDLKKQIREIENSLSLLTGKPGGKIDRNRFEDQILPAEFSVGIPSQLFLNRPDILQAEASLMAAYAATASARAAFLPGFSIGANGSWTNAAGTAILDPAKFVWQAVASLAMPLLNKGTNIANLRVAKAQQEIAANNFQKTLLAAANEISNALFQYQATGAKCQYRVQQVSSLEKAVEYTTQLMQLGGTTYLEVLTAQQSLLQAQLSQVADQYERMGSVITLYRALGGGSQETVEDVTADNWNKNKSVRKRARAIEKQVKALLKEEKQAAKAAKAQSRKQAGAAE